MQLLFCRRPSLLKPIEARMFVFFAAFVQERKWRRMTVRGTGGGGRGGGVQGRGNGASEMHSAEPTYCQSAQCIFGVRVRPSEPGALYYLLELHFPPSTWFGDVVGVCSGYMLRRIRCMFCLARAHPLKPEGAFCSPCRKRGRSVAEVGIDCLSCRYSVVLPTVLAFREILAVVRGNFDRVGI